MNILIVDDDPIVINFFRQTANFLGYDDVDTAASGEEALGQVVKREYDLVTIGIHMPGGSGLEIITLLRNMCPQAVLAIVSGHIPAGSSEAAACADALIDKPVSLETFRQLLSGASKIVGAMDEVRMLGNAPVTAR